MTTTTPPTGLPTTAAAPSSANWRTRGACRDEDPELFFPIAHTRGWVVQTRQAKQVCARCPVRTECLQWALETGQRAGVWGGLTEEERRARYQIQESQAERCWANQQWIEKQLAKGVSQRDIASQLLVTRAVLCESVQKFQAERTAGVVVEEVRAA